MSFTHLHLHTGYSILDGAGRIEDIIKRAKDIGQKSIAITDHGVMYGAVEFFETAISNGIKPIIGCEVYVVSGSRLERNKDEERYHLILLCENDLGYRNLLKIVSTGFVDGFYYKPRVDYETLSKYHEGLICLSACLAGEVQKELVRGNFYEARLRAENYINIFGKNNFFIEIQNHNLADEQKIHTDLIRLAKTLDVLVVATNDVHYTLPEDAFAHDCLLCMQTNKKLADADRMKYVGNNYYIKTEEEMLNDFKFYEEAVYNTQVIADRCNVTMEFNSNHYADILKNINRVKENEGKDFSSFVKKCEYHVPKFKIPDGETNVNYLKKLLEEGLNERYKEVTEEIRNRVDYELKIIIDMGFVDYFLIVWDYINYAKQNNIPVGPGRGSAAGSIIAYLLKITDVDPIKHKLIFERFLNPYRFSMPDIDTDFSNEGRDDVINYVREKYGDDHVAQIVTFTTLGAKNVIKSVGRVMDVPYARMGAITKMLPKFMQKNKGLYELLNDDIEEYSTNERMGILNFRDEYNSDSQVKYIIDTAMRIEKIPSAASIHASGVLIAKDVVTNFVPLSRSKEDIITTEYTMTDLEHLGMLKMDFLGLRNLDVIKHCVEDIKTNLNIDVDIDNIDYEDQKVYDMISEGDTLGVFQLESDGMTNFMKRLKPSCLEDIIAGISLYRPGPMQYIPKYIQGKKNKNSIKYDCDELIEILSPTYGCITYQEQVMQIVQKLAGYSFGRADIVRYAMAKKKTDILVEERKTFLYGNSEFNIDGCIKRGISEKVANKIFDDMMEFAKYAFNKPHAVSYAILGYQTAYLKHYYRLYFYTSMCNSVIEKNEELQNYVNAILYEGIKILPPDVNKSKVNFTVEGDNIRMGFAALKGIGQNVASDILEEREKNGPYDGFVRTIKRFIKVKVNKKAIENLIWCGAFDEFYGNRNQKINTYFKIDDKDTGPTIFDFLHEDVIEEDEDKKLIDTVKNIKEMQHELLLFLEKDICGIYLSGSPLLRYKDYIEKNVTLNSNDLFIESDENGEIVEKASIDGDRIKTLVVINDVIIRIKNSRWATLHVEDMNREFNVIIFGKLLNEVEEILEKNNIVVVEGRVQFRDNGSAGEIVADKVRLIQKTVWIRIKSREEYESKKEDIRDLFFKYTGQDKCNIYIEDDKQTEDLGFGVNVNENLISDLNIMFNEDDVKVTYK